MILFWAEPSHHVRETARPAIDCRIILGCPLSFILSPVFCTFRMHPQHIHPSPVLLPTSESKPLSSLIWVNWSSCCSYPQQSLSLIATRRIFKIIQVRSGHYPAKTFQLLPFEFEIRLEFLTQPARHQWASLSLPLYLTSLSLALAIPLSRGPPFYSSSSLRVLAFAPLLPEPSFSRLCTTPVASAQMLLPSTGFS